MMPACRPFMHVRSHALYVGPRSVPEPIRVVSQMHSLGRRESNNGGNHVIRENHCVDCPVRRRMRNLCGMRDSAAHESAEATLVEMIARDPAIHDVTRWAPAYAVFPAIGKGGVLIGGAYGRGILYEAGVATGYVSLEQASLGAQLGGETFSELLLLRNPVDIDQVKSGDYSVGANAGVVVLTGEASAHVGANSEATVFVLPRGGLMVDISI